MDPVLVCAVMQTTLFDHARDASPRLGPANWPDLVQLLVSNALTTPHPGWQALGPGWRDDAAAWKKVKTTMAAWSPAAFGGLRANKNVISHSAYAGDLDDVPEETLTRLRERLRSLGWAYVLHPTPTDEGPGKPRRYRIVVPYSSPVVLSDVPAVREAVGQLLGLGGEVDPVTKDPARLYFLPCLTEDGTPPAWETLPGAPIDTSAALGRLAGIDLLASRWPARGRHAAQLALAGGLISSGISEADAVEILCDVCRAAGEEDRPKRIETVRATADRFAQAAPIASWRALEAALTTAVVKRARAFLGAEGSALRRTDIVVSHRLSDMLKATMKALPSIEDLYRKDYQLVTVVHDHDRSGEVSPAIHPIDAAVLRFALTEVASFVRIREDAKTGELVRTDVPPPFDLVQALSRLGEWDTVPPLTGVVSAPCMREDGTFLTVPGYDEASGYLFEGLPPEDMPEAPTREDARAALDRLAYVFSDFPFDRPSGVYVVIGAILTLFARAAFRPTPAFIFDASTKGSGKTKLADAISIIATGRPAERTTYVGASDPETEKTLCAMALEGRQILLFDNVDRSFGGGSIDKVLTTEDRVSFRVLGVSEMRSPRWRTVIIATGNNVDLCADTASRSLMVRLEPSVERPEERTDFHEKLSFLDAVRRDRAALARDALIVLKAWAMAGRPQEVTRPRGVAGRFEAWFSVVPQALAFAGGTDICAESSAIATHASDVGADAFATMIERFGEAFPRGALVKDMIKICWPPTGMPTKHPELAEAFEVLCESSGAPTPTKLGSTVRKFRGRVRGTKQFLDRNPDSQQARIWIVIDQAALTAAAE